MKNQTTSLFLLFIILNLGCSEGKKSEGKAELVYNSESEKIINQTFLSLVGTDLYYKISEKDLEVANSIDAEEGREKALAYYEKRRSEDPTRLVVFIRDSFIYTSRASPKKLDKEMLSYIRYELQKSHFIKKEDSAAVILETLSQSLKLSSINLTQTGRYQIFNEEDKKRVNGVYNSFGSFNASRIYIDSVQNKATFFYEKNCMEGLKCAAGMLVILEKIKNQWIVKKKINLYVS